jgi:predicted RNase H-related nuclease YkuK (DUF458 family)
MLRKTQESSYFTTYHCDRSLWHKMEPSKNPNYKSKLCMNWMNHGKCRFGDRCAFAHGESELRKSKTIENIIITEVETSQFSLFNISIENIIDNKDFIVHPDINIKPSKWWTHPLASK